MRMPILVLLALLAAGCAPSPAPVIRVITPRAYTVPEQVDIAREHAVLTDEQLYRLKDGQLVSVDLHMMPVVLEEWERTRVALRATQP